MSATDWPSISVVIPVYNGEATIEDCLRSIFDLDYPPERYEVIVVDNASTDATAGILERHADRARVVQHSERGPSAARNRGIQEARHELVAFTDADCVVDRGWLRGLLPGLREDKVGIVGGRMLSKQPANRFEEFGEQIHDQEQAIHAYRLPYVVTMNWASPKRVLLEVGLFDERFLRSEDVDLSLRIHLAGYRLIYAGDAIIYHQNENTLQGLFLEGYSHGFHSIHVHKVHRSTYRSAGHRAIDAQQYRRLARYAAEAARRSDPHASARFVFNLGKRLGKLAGSLRYGYPEI